jgi:CRP/FNR family transcriptional regulator, cyclic AMP receptor protein
MFTITMKLFHRYKAISERSKNVKSALLAHARRLSDSARRRKADKSLLRRYRGPRGRSHLINALIVQLLVRDRDLAEAIARRVRLEEVMVGTRLIKQGSFDSDLFLILKGSFSISIDGRVVAHKRAGDHVGEMAVVDPHTPRSASVIATVDSVVARIEESDFSALADRYPRLWRRIALELARRLRRESAVGRFREKAHRTA